MEAVGTLRETGADLYSDDPEPNEVKAHVRAWAKGRSRLSVTSLISALSAGIKI